MPPFWSRGFPQAVVLFSVCVDVVSSEVACDLATCTCDGVDLAALSGQIFDTPTSSDGYAYRLSMCTDIPKENLPAGCAFAHYGEHPSVVKYKVNQPSDCIEVGSIGPCAGMTPGQCGMTGTADGAGGVTVTYRYTYGCKNTFVMSMTHEWDSAPSAVSGGEFCKYKTSWAGLHTSAEKCDAETTSQFGALDALVLVLYFVGVLGQGETDTRFRGFT